MFFIKVFLSCLKKHNNMDGRKKNGGARNGAGRKKLPKTEQKIAVTIFLKRGLVSAKGGQKILKQSLISYAEN